jgi:hypothetical protein
MKSHNRRFVFSCLIGLVLVGLAGQQALSQQVFSINAPVAESVGRASAMTPEEKLIRLA